MREQFEQALEKINAGSIHVGLLDYASVLRERRLKRSQFLEWLPSASFFNGLPYWDCGDNLFGGGPFVSESINCDLESLRPHPFEDNSVILLADYSGETKGLLPRDILRTQLKRANDMGYDVNAAFEFEFMVLNDTAESLRENGFARVNQFVPDNRCWSGQTAAQEQRFIVDLESCLEAGGIDPWGLCVELGPGVFEATLRAVDGMRAADDAALFRIYTRAFCRNQNKTASFMPSFGSDYPGLGGHVSLSLSDKNSGKNLFADSENGINHLAKSFIAGMEAVVPEAFAMCAQSVNAYKRFAPGTWAPKYMSWYPEAYTAAVRAIPHRGTQARLEFRLPGADCNPHLTLALMLGAGLDGIERGLVPSAPSGTGHPDDIPEGSKTFPGNLAAAATRIEGSELSRAIFGDRFIDHFVQVCKAEFASLARAVSAAEMARYLEA